MTNRSIDIPDRGLATSVVTALLVVVLGLAMVSLTCRGEASSNPGVVSSPGPVGPQPAASITLQ